MGDPRSIRICGAGCLSFCPRELAKFQSEVLDAELATLIELEPDHVAALAPSATTP